MSKNSEPMTVPHKVTVYLDPITKETVEGTAEVIALYGLPDEHGNIKAHVRFEGDDPGEIYLRIIPSSGK